MAGLRSLAARQHPREAGDVAEAGSRDSPRPAETRRLSRRLVEDLLTAATAAPSMHNTQPWRFKVCQDLIELRADPERRLPVTDPAGRAVHIACGAALLNLRLAAAVADREPVVRLLPDPDQPLLLATVRLAGPHQADEAERDLHAAITRRHTNRGPFSERPVPASVLAELEDAAQVEGGILHVLDHNEAARVLYLARDAERGWLADPAYREELARWVGGPRDQDGIPDGALGPRSPDRPAPVREFAPGRPAPAGYARFEENPQIVVLSTPSGGPAGWLAAGQALQRVLLTATVREVAACPLTQPLETAEAWLVRDPRSEREEPQMILRIGYGLPVPGTPRRRVTDVLDS
jgi:nitroreductase